MNDDASSCGGRKMPYILTKDNLVSFGITIKFIESLLKSFKLIIYVEQQYIVNKFMSCLSRLPLPFRNWMIAKIKENCC